MYTPSAFEQGLPIYQDCAYDVQSFNNRKAEFCICRDLQVRSDLEAEDSPSPLPSIPLEACNSPGLLSWVGKSGESSIL